MPFEIIALGLIIIIDLIVVVAVLRWGSKHDSHTDIRSPEASKAVQVLQAQARAAEAKLRAQQEAAAKAAQALPSAASADASTGTDADVASALGDEEARRQRREAALARKAAKAATRQTETSE